MPDHPATLPITELVRQCREKHVRRSGPGGQNRNKVETGIVLTHLPTGIAAEASERRSQRENRAVAVDRLRRSLALELRSPPAASPTPLWQSRVQQGRICVSESHDDFPALLAEALDVLAAGGWDLPPAARFLNCTSSQLLKFLKCEPRAAALLNARRAERGLRPLT